MEDSTFLNNSSSQYDLSMHTELVANIFVQHNNDCSTGGYFNNQIEIGNQPNNLTCTDTNQTVFTSSLQKEQATLPSGPLSNSNNVGPFFGSNYSGRNRYAPYYSRPHPSSLTTSNYSQSSFISNYTLNVASSYPYDRMEKSSTFNTSNIIAASAIPPAATYASVVNQNGQAITLQINNLDYSLDENSLRNFLLNQLKPITPVLSLVFEGSSFAKVTVPDIHFAKQVVSNLHRKKIGHKRMVVSYTRDSSSTEINTLRCQVAGLLKDVPYCTLPMYKFRELFQSRFKTSISVLDLYKMQDICKITMDKNEEKYISLHPDLLNSIETSPLMECLQHSVPYCTLHFKREQHKGWAEQEIEPLPNVFMTIAEIQSIISPLLKNHTGDIPVASLVHCIKEDLGMQICRNENGVNLEHLICCVQGIQITTNNFGIKILGWLSPENAVSKDALADRFHMKFGNSSDPLHQISREVVELVKMSPKSTMKFNRFIPAYHNHFGKQCRVADYGYTRLIELFEALSSVIQIMGDGENRQITLTHRTQIRRFTSDLLRTLRSQGSKSILLSQLNTVFSQTQGRNFDVTDYGVCDIVDILDGLVNSNTVVVTSIQNGNDILISIPKRKQTQAELEKTCVFASEVVDLFANAPQYTILFQKFVRSYHYHFGYQCRLSDYGFLKLADLMESIRGVVEIELANDEEKKICLSPVVAERIFAEQLEALIREFSGSSKTCMRLEEVLQLHKKKYGYQIQPQSLGVDLIMDAMKMLPYVELLKMDDIVWIKCHADDSIFRNLGYRACRIITDLGKNIVTLTEFINSFAIKYNEKITEQTISTLKHAIEVTVNMSCVPCVGLTRLMKFLMAIIKVLESRTMVLSELKSLMNISLGDCFEFGYANLYTLLRAHPDIFVVHIGQTHERSEISLVAHCELFAKKTITNVIRNSTQLAGRQEKKIFDQQIPSNIRQPLMPHNKMLKTTDFISYSQLAQDYFKPNPIPANIGSTSFNGDDILDRHISSSSYNNNKENFYNNIFNGSLNSSSNSDPNTSCGSVHNISDGTKLLDRRRLNSSLTSSNKVFATVNLPLTPNANYGPPKPDTPPSDNIPFWIDPVWASVNDDESKTIESLNIRLPELKSFNILPMLMSPYSLSKLENTKQMFSFDNSDRKIS